MSLARVPALAERALVFAARGCLVLLLTVPLVVVPHAAFPFVTGKAVAARVLIEIAFASWAVLAAFCPAWRPPRSTLLPLLGAGLAVAFVAAWFGAGFERSLWSTYSRPYGVVDTAHALAAVVVLASLHRTAGQWRALFGAHVVVGLAVALVAVTSYYRIAVPVYGLLPETNYPRVAGTLGNATYLGGYLAVVAALAAGLAVRAVAVGRERAAAGAPRWPAFGGALAWAGAAAVAVWGLTLSGSMGAFAALLAAAATPVALHGLVSPRRGPRLATAVALAAVAVAVAAVVAIAAARLEPVPRYAETVGAPIEGHPLIERASDPARALMPLRKRLELWQAAALGFLDRPLLGWGPGHFTVAYGRHTSGWGGATLIQDRAHGVLLEEAATKGAAGLAAYLALWGWLAVVFVRAMRSAPGPERRLIAFAAGALAAYFVHAQTLFETTATSVGWVLLAGFAVWLETPGERRTWWRTPRVPVLARRAATAALAAVAVSLAGWGIAANRDILAGAQALQAAEAVGDRRFMDHLGRAIGLFAPLATQPRMILFENVTYNWEVLTTRHPAEARRLIRWADAEAEAAVAAEPLNWRLHQALARLYTGAARTDPQYAAAARRHVAAVRELAPAVDPLEQPGPRP